jgi:hypothetical protein
MNEVYQSILHLKNAILINYIPENISYLAMEIFNKYSLYLDSEESNMILSIIAMDMGEEFVLSKEECLEVINSLLHSKQA